MNKNKGFTLIELLVVVAIIGILSAVILAVLGNARNQAKDAQIKSQVKSMVAQASLYSGTLGTAYVVPAGTSPTAPTITGAIAGGTAASGTLFNDTTFSNSGLYTLLSKLPSGAPLYYGWDGTSTLQGGLWFVIVGTSVGAICVDDSGTSKSWTGTTPSTTANFITAFPNATAAGGYNC